MSESHSRVKLILIDATKTRDIHSDPIRVINNYIGPIPNVGHKVSAFGRTNYKIIDVHWTFLDDVIICTLQGFPL